MSPLFVYRLERAFNRAAVLVAITLALAWLALLAKIVQVLVTP